MNIKIPSFSNLKFPKRAPVPINPIPRYPCPFYGFYGFFSGMRIFIDQQSNQCPLLDGSCPCLMEMAHETPDWEECQLNCNDGKATISKIEESYIISPREFYPEDRKNSLEGMAFHHWKKYVMGNNVKRPQ